MKQFCLKNGDSNTEFVRLALPFSLRNSPSNERDFQLQNDFAIFPVDMRLVSDLKTGIKQIQRDLSSLKTSPMPFGWYYASYFVLAMPYLLQSYFTEDLANALTMGFSNVPGAREHWYLTGKKCTAFGFSMPLGKSVPLGWGALSHGNNIKVLVAADKACVKDTDQLMEAFQLNLDNFLGSREWRKF